MSSSIKDKTIRPGSLNGYSYYHSNRKIEANEVPKKPRKSYKKLLLLIIVVVAVGFWLGLRDGAKNNNSTQPTATNSVANPIQTSASQANGINNCEGFTEAKTVKISVDRRRLWACEGSKSVYSVSVITGLRGHPETETPVGTYKIYGKVTDTTLTGSDSRGSWKDPVSYWMPFLDNQYGTYGFHDATWRANSEFGKVSPDSAKASHGCVELPLASSKWLYNWAPIGTTVQVVES